MLMIVVVVIVIIIFVDSMFSVEFVDWALNTREQGVAENRTTGTEDDGKHTLDRVLERHTPLATSDVRFLGDDARVREENLGDELFESGNAATAYHRIFPIARSRRDDFHGRNITSGGEPIAKGPEERRHFLEQRRGLRLEVLTGSEPQQRMDHGDEDDLGREAALEMKQFGNTDGLMFVEESVVGLVDRLARTLQTRMKCGVICCRPIAGNSSRVCIILPLCQSLVATVEAVDFAGDLATHAVDSDGNGEPDEVTTKELIPRWNARPDNFERETRIVDGSAGSMRQDEIEAGLVAARRCSGAGRRRLNTRTTVAHATAGLDRVLAEALGLALDVEHVALEVVRGDPHHDAVVALIQGDVVAEEGKCEVEEGHVQWMVVSKFTNVWIIIVIVIVIVVVVLCSICIVIIVVILKSTSIIIIIVDSIIRVQSMLKYIENQPCRRVRGNRWRQIFHDAEWIVVATVAAFTGALKPPEEAPKHQVLIFTKKFPHFHRFI